jgi:hypothetical protein
MAQDVLPEYYRTVDPVEALRVRVCVRRRRTVASHARRGDRLGDTLAAQGTLVAVLTGRTGTVGEWAWRAVGCTERDTLKGNRPRPSTHTSRATSCSTLPWLHVALFLPMFRAL